MEMVTSVSRHRVAAQSKLCVETLIAIISAALLTSNCFPYEISFHRALHLYDSLTTVVFNCIRWIMAAGKYAAVLLSSSCFNSIKIHHPHRVETVFLSLHFHPRRGGSRSSRFGKQDNKTTQTFCRYFEGRFEPFSLFISRRQWYLRNGKLFHGVKKKGFKLCHDTGRASWWMGIRLFALILITQLECCETATKRWEMFF